ncbi:MAG: hypothetical protein GEV04_25370, partial [Actinophytocola sp.]|nr:hypothetical protein [Actinophytocola sp.]
MTRAQSPPPDVVQSAPAARADWWRDSRTVGLAALVTVLLLVPVARPLIGPYNYTLHIMLVAFMWVAI